MGRALPALLGRAADPAGQPARRVRGVAALQPVPAVPRRPRRCAAPSSSPAPSRCARTCSRSGPARSSARTRISAATGPSPGASRPARSRSAPTRWSASSRCSTSVRCWATAPSSGTRRRCSPGRWCRTARAGTARPPSGATSTTGWCRPRGAGGCAGSPTGCGSWRTSWSCPSRSASRWSLYFLERIPVLPRLIEPGTTTADDPAVHLQVLGYVAALFVGGIVAGLVFVATVPRLVQPGPARGRRAPALRDPLLAVPDRRADDELRRSTCALFGDSSAIVHYLRLVGYRFGRPLVQSGSNFGVAVRHENPYLSGVGSGTMVSDGLSFMNAEYSSTSFRLRRVAGGRPQLPRQRHRLPGRRADRRQLPARDEGHGADRRAGPARRRAARLAGVRDPADGASATAPSTTSRPAGELRRLLRAKNRHNAVDRGAVPARAAGDARTSPW